MELSDSNSKWNANNISSRLCLR